jgi:hypothetical protein
MLLVQVCFRELSRMLTYKCVHVFLAFEVDVCDASEVDICDAFQMDERDAFEEHDT